MISWNRVTIIGVGLIGGSLGLALKAEGLARRVVGVGHRQVSLDQALARGAADEATLDPAAGAGVLATSPALFRGVMERIGPALAPGAIVIDVGSTKAGIVAALEPMVPEGRVFVGCHPIAGSEQRGIEHARADLFQGASCILTPTERTPPAALDRVGQTWRGVGARVRVLSPQEHDRLLAEVSHLVHLASASLVNVLDDNPQTVVGPGWIDTTRVASGDPALWRDILLSNATEVAAALGQYQRNLDAFRKALLDGDGGRIEGVLTEAKTRRDRLIESKESR
jgi:prephenate dehydrogenase